MDISSQALSELRDRDDLDEIRDRLESFPNVHSTGLSYREENGELTKEPVIVAYVLEKLDESQLTENEILPRELRGISIDVREVDLDSIELQESDKHSQTQQNRIRPIVGGSMMSNPTDEKGTIAFGVLNSNGTKSLLSTYHLSNDGDGLPTDMYQPIEDAYEPNNNKIGTSNEGAFDPEDWALTPLDDQSQFTNEVIGAGAITEIGALPDRMRLR